MEESRIVYDAFEDIIASNETCEFFGMKLFLVLMECYSLAMQPDETST